jgi:predicted phage tail protein
VTLFAAEDADNENGTAIFLCSDPSGTYSSVSFTAIEADKDVPPPVPTGLVGVPSMGQVDLSWHASLNATSYNIKRSTTAGSGYATVGTPTGTNFSDSVANGMTYYYVVSAVGDSGESADSDAVSVTLLHALPFTEDFEALSVGDLAGQNLWEASDTVVQTNQAVEATGGRIDVCIGVCPAAIPWQ